MVPSREADALEASAYDDVTVLLHFERLRQAYRDDAVVLEQALMKATVDVLGDCAGFRLANESDRIEDVVYYVAKSTRAPKDSIRRVARERFAAAFQARMQQLCMPKAVPIAEELSAPILAKRRLQWLTIVK